MGFSDDIYYKYGIHKVLNPYYTEMVNGHIEMV